MAHALSQANNLALERVGQSPIRPWLSEPSEMRPQYGQTILAAGAFGDTIPSMKYRMAPRYKGSELLLEDNAEHMGGAVPFGTPVT